MFALFQIIRLEIGMNNNTGLENIYLEIEKLKKDNQQLVLQVKQLTEALLQFAQKHQNLQNRFEDMQQNTATSLRLLDYGLNNYMYEVKDPCLNENPFFYPKIFTVEETLQDLISNKKSIARYGDGEFAIMANKNRQKFQSFNPELAHRLIEIINTVDEKFMVAIADNYGYLGNYSRAGKSGIRNYLTKEVREEHQAFLSPKRKYYNAYISRPYVLFGDWNTDGPRQRFEQLKQIWNQREVIIVEGEKTRMGVGNDLLDNAKSVRRILGPAENAFEKYNQLLSTSLDCACEDTLFLIALGPTAGVLAFDLYKRGYQAIDIGHLDMEYEWFLRGEGKRVPIKGKYNNEVVGGEIVEEINDACYISQIISII